uniref:Uncharacterized protein n=1 Tax=Chlorobium phaeovibrioides (strain DSM 265 / 1930) TaxID=290318 RepID=A4SCA1_CHLPM
MNWTGIGITHSGKDTFGMDVKTSTLETRTVTVYQLLTEVEKLTIPQYQRPYKWTSRHVGQLFSDIAAFRHKNAYRLGTVVFHHDNDSHTHNIVDGQQRTITLMLAVHALIYNREKTSDGPRRKDLDKQLGELKAKMPDPCFENNISKRNIHANYLQISRIVRRDDFDEDQIHFLLNRCNFVTFALKDISEAFQFFDSQNARGKDLEPHDLLKAFHLRELSNHENDLKSETVSRWENSETAELSALFAQYLYRIRNWTRGESARYFGKEDTDLFKGVNIDTASDFPYIEQLRLAHHFVEQYNNAYERKVDGNKMQFPFHIDQIIINGRRFFEMTNHYLSRVNEATGHDEYKTFLDDNAMIGNTKEILDTINTYEGRNRTGDMYVRMMFDCMLIYYIDKFGVIELPRAIENIFIWAYSLRLQMQVVQLASMDNHVLENNLFKRLKDATDPREFLDISLPAVTENRSKKTKDIERLFKGMGYYDGED